MEIMVNYEDVDPETKRLRAEHKARLAAWREKGRWTGVLHFDRRKLPDSLLIERGFVASPRRPKIRIDPQTGDISEEAAE